MSLGHGASIVRDGLVLHLDAANVKSYPGSGTTWSDLSGNGNNGTLVNGLIYNTVNNGTLLFDGISDYISLSASSSWAIGENGTIEQWVYPTNSTGNNRLWSVTNNSSSLDAYLNGTSYNLYFHGNASSGGTLIPNKWNHVCVTYTNGVIQSYINSNPAVMSGTLSGYNITNTNILYLGRYGGGGYNLYGSLSVNNIYSRALTATEVKQNFEATRGRYGI